MKMDFFTELDDPLHTVHKFNRQQPWDGSPVSQDGGGDGSSGIYGVIKHMTDDPHSLDEYSYGRIPEPPPKMRTSTPNPLWHDDDQDDQDDTYDPHK